MYSRVVPSWWAVVCTSAKFANCIAQMGGLNTAEPLSDGHTVQAQSAIVVKSIYMNDVFLLYYWGGDNVWKWLLLSHKRHEDRFVETLI